MAKPRIYPDGPCELFAVRIQEKHANSIKELADKLGVPEVQAKRLIVEAGLKALKVT